MEQVITFLENYIQAEYDAMIALHTERNEEKLNAKIDIHQSFYDESVRSVVQKPFTPRDEQYFLNSIDSLPTIRMRKIIQIKKYLGPKIGEVFSCYLSLNLRTTDKVSYFVNFFITQKRKQLKIISEYLICTECSKFGEDYIEAKSCEFCKGTGWEYFYGVNFKELGKLVEIKKLNPPDNEKNKYLSKELKDYKSD